MFVTQVTNTNATKGSDDAPDATKVSTLLVRHPSQEVLQRSQIPDDALVSTILHDEDTTTLNLSRIKISGDQVLEHHKVGRKANMEIGLITEAITGWLLGSMCKEDKVIEGLVLSFEAMKMRALLMTVIVHKGGHTKKTMLDLRSGLLRTIDHR